MRVFGQLGGETSQRIISHKACDPCCLRDQGNSEKGETAVQSEDGQDAGHKKKEEAAVSLL